MRLTLEFADHSLAAELLQHGDELSDPAIVLLHDALGCMGTWKEFPQVLFDATGLGVVMFDRRGHGLSSPLSDEVRTSEYLEDDARRLPEILDKLGVRRAILVGHSDGGSIALVAAALWPERVASVVSIAAHVMLEEVTVQGVRVTVATADETRLVERLRKYHGEKSERLYSVWHETWLNPAHREWNLLHYLPKIQCPVLVMQGELDEYGTVEQVNAIVNGVQTPSPNPFPMNGEGGTEGGLKRTRWKSIPKVHFQFAREMRKEATEAEKALWKSLAKDGLGVSFRRQHPIGPFIVDFFASSIGLVIEVDGGVHLPDDAKEYDALRDEQMQQAGLTVLRFVNDDVLKRLDWVLSEIRKQIQTPTPGPFPINGEGETEADLVSGLPSSIHGGRVGDGGLKRVRAVMYPGVGHAPQRVVETEVVEAVLGFVSGCYLE